jgi:hypothetical protein
MNRAGWGAGLGYARGPHEPRFREFRRLFHQSIGPRQSMAPTIVQEQQHAVRSLLRHLFREPESFEHHLRE